LADTETTAAGRLAHSQVSSMYTAPVKSPSFPSQLDRMGSSRAGYSTFQLLQMSADKSENVRDQELDYLEDCLKQVPEKQRTLLDMKYTMNRSSDEIAKSLKKTREWVRTNLFRIRQNLKDCIEAKISRG